MKKKSIINKIYGKENTDKVLKAIDNCIEKYKSKIQSKKYTLNHKDMVLITYGDQISHGSESKLKTLKRFSDEYLNPGINSIHILPFYPYTSDDGFSVIDYKKVDENLGDWKDIELLSENYRIMFDAVINHISKSSSWFKEYLDENPDYKSFFIDVDPNEDLSKVVRPRALPLLTVFKNKSGKKLNIWTTFSEDQVDLNFQNYKVLVAILDVLLFYISNGAKLIRLDAVGFMWKESDSSCMHLPEVHYIIQLFRKIVDELTADVTLITETNVPHVENISYFGNGYNESQMVYNFSLPPLLAYSIHKENTKIITQWAQTLTLPSQETCFFNFTASHDGVGVRPLQGIVSDKEIDELAAIAEKHGGKISYKNNPDNTKSPYELNCNYLDFITNPSESVENRAKRFLLTQAVMLSMPGVPGIYFHSLVGSQNYYQGVIDSGINRRINREKLSYVKLIKEIEEKDSLRNKVYYNYINLLKIRSKEVLFNPFGNFSFPFVDEQLFVIKRTLKNSTDSLYAYFNFSKKTKTIKLEKYNSITCLIGNKKIFDSFELKPFEFAWIKYSDV